MDHHAKPHESRFDVNILKNNSVTSLHSSDINSVKRQVIQPTVSVVIPTLNEAKNLPHVFPHLPAWVHEVIVVDGDSTDNTTEVARLLHKDVRIIKQHGSGKGAALRTGFAAATGEIIVMLDADGSMSPAEIPIYVAELLAGADFAKGSRFLPGGGTHDMEWFRYLGNLFLTFLVRLLYGGQYSDLCYGYNAFWRSVLPHLELDADGFEIETQMNVRILQAGFNVREVPSFEAQRIYGTSNLNTWRDGWRILKIIINEWLWPRITDGAYRISPQPVYLNSDQRSVGMIGEG